MLAIPTVFLRGGFHQATTTELDGLARLTSLESLSLGATLWNEPFNNASLWSLSGSSPATLEINGSLSLNVVFPAKSTPQAILISRAVNLPLDHQPVLSLQLKVSVGVAYGIRFWGATATNKSFVAWGEGSSLQHRSGLGTYETVLVNLVAESYRGTP